MQVVQKSVGVILGSAFYEGLEDELTPIHVQTSFGNVLLFERERASGPPAYVLFRHGAPHNTLPHQINYRANAAALAQLGVGALLVTSSVGVLDSGIPINTPLVIDDLLMPENRLPDGSTCTMFVEPGQGGHLVLEEGIVSRELSDFCASLIKKNTGHEAHRVVFGYVGGPRTKTPAENRMWALWGAQVNSMSVGPELVLANELQIPCAGLVVGHKYSHPDIPNPDSEGVEASLVAARQVFRDIVFEFMDNAYPVQYKNSIYTF